MADNSFPPSPFSPARGHNPFVGIATFAGYPFWKPDMQADAVVLGIPYDEGVTNRPGTRFGPRSVRNASMLYTYEDQKYRFYDADRRKWILSGKTIADAGDVDIQTLRLEENYAAITESVSAILQAGAVSVVIGGDHSVTYPVVKAFKGQKFHYIHFDTHIDCDRIFGSGFTHGSPVARIMEDGLAESFTLAGIRGLTNSGHDFEWIEEQGAKIITARELRKAGAESLSGLPSDVNYYISVDIDFFDPAAAPGTGTPEPGGLFFPEFSDAVHAIAARGKIIGFDVVEVNPFFDGHDAITSQLAARCLIELLSAALD